MQNRCEWAWQATTPKRLKASRPWIARPFVCQFVKTDAKPFWTSLRQKYENLMVHTMYSQKSGHGKAKKKKCCFSKFWRSKNVPLIFHFLRHWLSARCLCIWRVASLYLGSWDVHPPMAWDDQLAKMTCDKLHDATPPNAWNCLWWPGIRHWLTLACLWASKSRTCRDRYILQAEYILKTPFCSVGVGLKLQTRQAFLASIKTGHVVKYLCIVFIQYTINALASDPQPVF